MMVRVRPHEWSPLRVRELRARLGVTQGEFAARLSELARARGGKPVNRYRIISWEMGHEVPSGKRAALLRDAERLGGRW